MLPFARLKWPEMRAVALALIARVHDGHNRREFTIPVVDFVKVFSPDASESELGKLRERGDIQFTAESTEGGLFSLAEGARSLLDLGRDGFVIRIPLRMSGRYSIYEGGFRVEFNEGEELEGCKRFFLLVCNRVVSVDVTTERVYARAPKRIFDLLVEFE
jgi:hypothetical protein